LHFENYNIKLYIDLLIDVNDYEIYSWDTDIGSKIQNLLNSLDQNYPNQQKIVYFPPGNYFINKPISIPSYTIIKGAGGDVTEDNQTRFSFEFLSGIDGVCISLGSSQCSGLEDISLIDQNDPEENDYKNTVEFGVSSMHCWMRGVESRQTRRFHVSIYGTCITVSGCYIHHAWDYSDDGGRGYGVCLGGESKFCRIENNIFKYLRHSMVFQYYAHQNVMSYNYSREVHATNGGYVYPAADLLFHGKHDETYGPSWNLCEGNISQKIRFDDIHDENGPYNVIMRCRAIDDDAFKVEKVQGTTLQFMQNVVGTDAEPYYNLIEQNFTENWINEHGFSVYWWQNPDWSQIPSNECSYYRESKPPFFYIWLPWPFIGDNLIPAKYRYDRNNGYYQNDPPTSEVVNAGWDLYENYCGPPHYFFNNGDVLVGQNKEYIASDDIVAGNLIILSNNNIIMNAENKISLKPGFKVTNSNNYFLAKAGYPCENEKYYGNDQYLYSEPNLTTQILEPDIKNEIDNIHRLSFQNNNYSNAFEVNSKANKISIIPNPNNGHFSIYFSLDKEKIIDIEVTDLFGKKIKFSKTILEDCIAIDISKAKNGIYLLIVTTDFAQSSFKIIKE